MAAPTSRKETLRCHLRIPPRLRSTRHEVTARSLSSSPRQPRRCRWRLAPWPTARRRRPSRRTPRLARRPYRRARQPGAGTAPPHTSAVSARSSPAGSGKNRCADHQRRPGRLLGHGRQLDDDYTVDGAALRLGRLHSRPVHSPQHRAAGHVHHLPSPLTLRSVLPGPALNLARGWPAAVRPPTPRCARGGQGLRELIVGLALEATGLLGDAPDLGDCQDQAPRQPVTVRKINSAAYRDWLFRCRGPRSLTPTPGPQADMDDRRDPVRPHRDDRSGPPRRL